MSRYSLPSNLKHLRVVVFHLFGDGQGHCFERNQLVSFDVIARHLNNQIGVNTDHTLTVEVSDALLSEAFRYNEQSSQLGQGVSHYSVPLSFFERSESDEPARGVSGRRSTRRRSRRQSHKLRDDEEDAKDADEDADEEIVEDEGSDEEADTAEGTDAAAYVSDAGADTPDHEPHVYVRTSKRSTTGGGSIGIFFSLDEGGNVMQIQNHISLPWGKELPQSKRMKLYGLLRDLSSKKAIADDRRGTKRPSSGSGDRGKTVSPRKFHTLRLEANRKRMEDIKAEIRRIETENAESKSALREDEECVSSRTPSRERLRFLWRGEAGWLEVEESRLVIFRDELVDSIRTDHLDEGSAGETVNTVETFTLVRFCNVDFFVPTKVKNIEWRKVQTLDPKSDSLKTVLSEMHSSTGSSV